MSRKGRDPLLAFADAIVVLLHVLLIFVMAMLLIGLGAILTVRRPDVLAEISAAGAADGAYWAIIGVLVLLEGVLGCAARFMLELRGIVRSVESGDPFEPENAARLSRMGWLTTAGYMLGIVASGLAGWVGSITKFAVGELDVDVDLGGGVLLILTLFILARVFRKGAEMREELDGTV